MTADSNIVVAIKGQLGDAPVIKRNLDEISAKGDKATGQMDRFDKKLQTTSRSAGALAGAMKALVAAIGVREISRAVDQFTLLEARIKNSTRSTDEFKRSMQGLVALSTQTGASFEAAVEVFQRISFVRDEISATADEMLLFTGLVQKLGVTSGVATQNLNAGLRQLGQGLSSGILRAEEFNSILENIPAVAVTIAKELGVTTGQLRNLVIDGQVLSKDVFTAILNQSQDINKQFEKFPMTIGRAFNAAVLGLQITTGEFANATGANDLLIAGITKVGKVIETVLNLVQILVLTMKLGFSRAVENVTINILELGRTIENVVNKSINAFNKLPGPDIANVNFASTITAGQLRAESEAEAIADLQRIASAGKNMVTSANATFGRESAATTASVAATGQISKNYAEIAKNIGEGTKKKKEAKRELTEYEKSVKSLGDSIRSSFVDSFEDAFNKSGNFFESWLGGMKRSFTRFMGEIAFQAASRPIGLNLIAGVAGGAGGMSAGSAFAGGGGSGGFGLSNLSSLGKLASGFGGPSPMLVSGMDRIGSMFGMGGMGPMPNGGVTGGLSQYSTLTNGSFGGTLGGMAGGFAGNLAANAIFGSDRGIGASIGGTIGAIAGSFIPIPIVGTALGSFLGNAVGGLFGGGPKRESIGFGLDKDLNIYGVGTKGVDMDKANQFASSIQKSVAQIVQLSGGTLSQNIGIGSNIGKKDTNTTVDGIRVSGKAGDVDAIIGNIISRGLIKGVDPIIQQVLDKSVGKSAKVITENLGIAQLIASFEKAEEKANPLKLALDGLETQFEMLKKKATELGLPVQKLGEGYEKQRKALIDGALKPLQDFLDSQALSSTSSLSPADRLSLARSSFDKNLASIKEGNLDGLGSLTGQASQLLNIGRDVFASSESFARLESFVRQSVAGVAGDLGAGGSLNPDVGREIVIANAQQNSLLDQLNIKVQLLTEENRKLRKAMERVGNAVVQA